MGRIEPSKPIRSLADLRPDPANANRGTQRGRGMLEASLRELGAGRSILVDKYGTIIAGNKTAEVAADIGLDDVILVQTDGTKLVAVQRTDLDLSSDMQAKRLAIADNRTGEVGLDWEPGVLQAFLDEDRAALDGLFTSEEVAELMAEAADEDRATGEDPGAEVDRAAELQAKWNTERGQVWTVGKHRLMCGDSTSAEDVARLMDGQRAALLVTSPPYNQSIDKFRPSGMHKEGDWVAKVERLAYADSLPENEYQAQQRRLLDIWYGFLGDCASVFYNHKNRYREKQVVSPLEWLPGPFKFRQEIVWSRPGSVTQNARMFLPSDERIYWLYKGDDFLFNDTTEIKTYSTVWDIPLETNKDHAVAFPLALPTRCIEACTNLGGLVVEPYLGSGTTMVASENLGRVCFGMEVDPSFAAVALERLSTMGLIPRLAD